MKYAECSALERRWGVEEVGEGHRQMRQEETRRCCDLTGSAAMTL